MHYMMQSKIRLHTDGMFVHSNMDIYWMRSRSAMHKMRAGFIDHDGWIGADDGWIGAISKCAKIKIAPIYVI